ncbi:MAG: histidine phosphatase family protein [Caproiciproducens sp.]|nr:histidine phosphatase family protein [Caproiciproducens sp.]
MKSYTIHLIRHGITEGNLLGQYVGRTDLPLAQEGIAHLEELKHGSPYPTAQVYYCSPLKRCVQTLRILYPEAQPIVVEDLRECDFGDWEGKTAKELADSDENFAEWMESNRVVTPPNGESGGVFMQRVCAAFEKIVEGMMRSGTSSAVIVAHGGTIMSILSAYGLPRANFYDWMTENGCGYSLRITPGLWMRSMVAEVYATIPEKPVSEEDDQKLVINLAREAADRAFGKKEEE